MALAEASRQATPAPAADPLHVGRAARHRRPRPGPPGPHRARRLPRLAGGRAARPVGRGDVVPEPRRRRSRRPRARRHVRSLGRRLVRADRPRRLPRAPAGRRGQRGGDLQRVGVLPALPVPREGGHAHRPAVRGGRGAAQRRARRARGRAHLGGAALGRARRPPAPARAARPRRGLPVVLLPDDRGDAQALHRGARGRPRRRCAAAARPAPLPARRRSSPCPWASPAASPPRSAAAALIHLAVRWREDRAAGIRPLDGQRASAVVMLGALGGQRGRVAGRRRAGHRGADGLLRRAGGVGAAPGQGARSCCGSSGPGRARASPGSSCSSRSSPPTSRSSSAATAGGSASRRGPGRWPTRSTSSPSCAPSRACGASCCWTSRSPPCSRRSRCAPPTGRASCPHWRRRVAVVLLVVVGGLVWWTCALLVYTPWGSFPP